MNKFLIELLVLIVMLNLMAFSLGGYSGAHSKGQTCNKPTVRLEYIMPFFRVGCYVGAWSVKEIK